MADSEPSASHSKVAYLTSIVESNEPKCEEDLIVLTIHAVLLKNGFEILCVGNLGKEDATNSNKSQEKGLSLPSGWNSQPDPDCYEFNYANASGEVNSLRLLRIGDQIHISLVPHGENERNASQLNINIADVIARKKKPITTDWLSNVDSLWSSIEKRLCDRPMGKTEKTASELKMAENLRQTMNQENRKEDASPIQRQPINLMERSPDSYGIQGSFPQPPPSSLYAEAQRIPRASPFAYGDADRLPGHPGMGGMMMDPLRSGGMGLRPPHMPGIPRGSVPPGARFDPYGPLTEFDYSSGSRVPRRPFNPNPDHLRRPGFDDDMFM